MPDPDQRWAEHQRAHDRAEEAHRREHEAEARALDKGGEQLEHRLTELNKLREEVVLDRTQFVRADTWAAEHKALQQGFEALVEKLALRIDAVEKAYDRAEGAVNTWRWLAGFLGIGGVALIVWSLATFGHP